MFNSWFHIRSIARFLAKNLPGCAVGTCFTFQKDELQIGIDGNDLIKELQFCFHNPLPFLRLNENCSEPRHKVHLFKTLSGLIIARAFWHKNDRQILIEFKDGQGYLLFQLYGINGNVFFLSKDFELLETFAKIRKTPEFSINDFIDSDSIEIDLDQSRNILKTHPDLIISKLLTKLPIPVFSMTIAQEICFRSKITKKTLAVNLTEFQSETLLRVYQEILQEIEMCRFFIYPSESPVFSLLELRSKSGLAAQSFGSVQEATNHFISLYYQTNVLEQTRKQLSSRLTGALQLLQRKLIKQEQELANLPTADEYREWADTLLTNVHRIEKRSRGVPSEATEVLLPKLNNPDEMITIPLNPKLTAPENANKYYEMSRRIDQSRLDLASSIEQNKETIGQVSGYLQEIEICDDLKEIRRIKKNIPAHFIEQQAAAESEERKPYHSFLLKNQTIWIGKSAKDNDLLSFKHARPEDFWFHVEHGPGSHVVVRNPNKQDSLPNDIIEIAAGIAAFYSKAKHSTVVPVIYTKRKYVWKRKDMPPGQVFTKFTKSVIVKPLDPKAINPI